MMEHRHAIRTILEQLREANADLIAEANAERDAIIAAYQSGEITHDEARQQLRELSERIREAIKNNPANAPFLQALCDSKLALFAEIRSILNDSQRDRWESWAAGLPGDCING